MAAIKDRNPDSPDVLLLLAEIENQRERLRFAVGLIRSNVLPAMRGAWEYLRSRKQIPNEAPSLDSAIGELEGHLCYVLEDGFKVAQD
jgi:hypothetical protein